MYYIHPGRICKTFSILTLLTPVSFRTPHSGIPVWFMYHITTKQKIASSRVFSLGEVKSRTVVVAPVLAEFSMRLLYPSLKFPPPSIFWVRICQNSAETQCLTHKKSCWRLGDTFSPSRDLLIYMLIYVKPQ